MDILSVSLETYSVSMAVDEDISTNASCTNEIQRLSIGINQDSRRRHVVLRSL
jgi:hypothetical protein